MERAGAARDGLHPQELHRQQLLLKQAAARRSVCETLSAPPQNGNFSILSAYRRHSTMSYMGVKFTFSFKLFLLKFCYFVISLRMLINFLLAGKQYFTFPNHH